MDTVERIIKKMAIIQLLFLLFFQLIFHSEHAFGKWKTLVRYEGVIENNYTAILETISNK
jgi:hypothetical protein